MKLPGLTGFQRPLRPSHWLTGALHELAHDALVASCLAERHFDEGQKRIDIPRTSREISTEGMSMFVPPTKT